MAPLESRRVPGDGPPATELVAARVAELAELYGPIDGPASPSATPEDFSAPYGAFVVLAGDGRPLAGGGVKRLGDGLAEIKRMYVVPEARGRGVGRLLLGALEQVARELGYARVRLDTGRFQPEVRALFLSAGYREIGDYDANPKASFWGEKAL